MSEAETAPETNEFVDFWNEVLVPKFIKYKHVLVGGLSHHSEAILPALPIRQGDSVLDVGCGFGDTAVYFAERVGPTGRVVGMDCCDAFMDHGIEEAADAGLDNPTFIKDDDVAYPFAPQYELSFSPSVSLSFSYPLACP